MEGGICPRCGEWETNLSKTNCFECGLPVADREKWEALCGGDGDLRTRWLVIIGVVVSCLVIIAMAVAYTHLQINH